jgi:anaerobic magnesium-protoporphyrin IX monomethyl ester cyclase
MRIVLVHPAGSNWVPGQRDITPIANRMAPLGLLSMAAWLRRSKHHRVSVYDCLGYDRLQPHAAIVRDILAGQPDLVGFSATTSGFLDGYDLAVAI